MQMNHLSNWNSSRNNGIQELRDRTGEFAAIVEQIQSQKEIHGENANTRTIRNSNKSMTFGNYTHALMQSKSKLNQEFKPQNILSTHEEHKQNDPENAANAYEKRSKFTLAASHIASNISTVAEKLEKLTRLAKQKTLFNDPTQEINELIGIIKNDMQHLSKEIEILAGYAQSQRDGSGTHNKAVVKQLKNSLANQAMSFQNVLQVRTNNLKEQNKRRKQFEGSSEIPRRKHTVNPFEDLLHNSNLDENQQALLQEQEMQEQDQSVEYARSRAEAMESIERSINELAQLYKQLTSMVLDQEEVVIRIDQNVEDATMNIEMGHQQLLKWFERASNNKWLILKIFAILIVFILFL